MISRLSNFSGPLSSLNIVFNRFRYYKWTINSVVGGPGNPVQVGEFKFTTNGITQSMSGVSISNPPDNGNEPSHEGIENLIDDILSSKWLNKTEMISNGYTSVYFDFGSEYSFNGYKWMTGNDSDRYPERTPVSWIIYGSNDNTNWITLHTVNSYTPNNNNNTWQSLQSF
jgi:hypothetical protein